MPTDTRARSRRAGASSLSLLLVIGYSAHAAQPAVISELCNVGGCTRYVLESSSFDQGLGMQHQRIRIYFTPRRSRKAQDYGAEAYWIDCQNPRAVDAGQKTIRINPAAQRVLQTERLAYNAWFYQCRQEMGRFTFTNSIDED